MKGRRHLGAIIGSKEYKRQYVSETDRIGYMKLSFCLISIKLFVMKHMLHLSPAINMNSHVQTVPDISHYLKPPEHVIRHRFIKSVIHSYERNDTERKLFTLPVKHGGLSVFYPSERCQIEFENS